MNSALGKEILALVREGDYAHAGEEEAIYLALDSIPKAPDRRVLDAGCGRGGTARFVQDHGWGKVCGIDIEADSITRAQALHPDLKFVAGDVVDAANHFSNRFDLIYLFNAFYAFPDQPAALRSLRSVANPEAGLMIFDYADGKDFPDGKEFAQSDFARLDEAAHWQPLQSAQYAELLGKNGWGIERAFSTHGEYLIWYRTLVRRIQSKREAIVQLAGEGWFQHTLSVYRSLLQAVEQNALSGVVIYARALSFPAS